MAIDRNYFTITYKIVDDEEFTETLKGIMGKFRDGEATGGAVPVIVSWGDTHEERDRLEEQVRLYERRYGESHD
jgi:hypothetical protein